MPKLVFWLALIGAVFLVARLMGLVQRRDAARKRERAETPPQRAIEMARCAHCGVHFPSGDALRDGAEVYCSEAHRRAGPG